MYDQHWKFDILVLGLIFATFVAIGIHNKVSASTEYDCNSERPRFGGREFEDEFPSGKFVLKGPTVKCDGRDCSCPYISYHILSGNDDHIFGIDEKTGEIEIASRTPFGLGRDRFIFIGAKMAGSYVDEVRLIIKATLEMIEPEFDVKRYAPEVNNGWDDEEHRRFRRAAGDFPDNVTFLLTREGEHASETEMKVGSKFWFKLLVTMPAGDTDLLIELFSPDNSSTVMMLCEVNVTLGTELSTTQDGSNCTLVSEAKDGTKHMDRVIIDCGNVTNGAGTANLEDGQITVWFSATMIDDPNATNGTSYWVSAGAEYNDDSEIYVAQAELIAIVEDTFTPDQIQGNGTAPSSLSPFQAGLFEIEAMFPYGGGEVVFEFFSPINSTIAPVMNICALKMKSAGAGFACDVDPESYSPAYTNDASVTTVQTSAKLDLKTITNQVSRSAFKTDEDSTLKFMAVAEYIGGSAVPGTTYTPGAAMQLSLGGTTKEILAYTIDVLTDDVANATCSGFPTVDVAFRGSDTSAVNEPIVFDVTIDVPYDFASTIEFEVLSPHNDSVGIYKMCAVTVISVGDCMPCVDQSKFTTLYYARESSPYKDRVVLNLGQISCVPWKTPQEDPDCKKIKLEVVVTPQAHALAIDGSRHKVTFGMKGNGANPDNEQCLWVNNIETGVTDTVTKISVIDNSTQPDFDLDYSFGTDQIMIGASTEVELTIKTKANVSYPTFQVEFNMPDGNSTGKPLFTVCRTEVISTGRNVPCFLPSEMNTKFEYTSSNEFGMIDRSALDAGLTCNLATLDDTLEDEIKIKAYIRIEDHADVVALTPDWVAVGAKYSNETIWVAMIQATPIVAAFSGQAPHAVVFNNESHPSIEGYTGKYNILIKTHPNETVDISVNATITATTLSICGIRIVEVGDSIACLNKTSTTGTVEPWVGAFGNEKASIYLGVITNVGGTEHVADSTFDANSILLEVTVKIPTPGTEASYAMNVLVDSPTTAFAGFTVLPNTPITTTTNTSLFDTTINPSSTHDFYIGEISGGDNNETVHSGQSRRVVLEITMPEGVTRKQTVKFLTAYDNKGIVEICNAAVISVGENIAGCFDWLQVNAVITARTSTPLNDIATLELGNVCNSGMKPGIKEANTITIEAILRFQDVTAQAMVQDDILWASGTVTTNEKEIYCTQLNFTAQDPSANFTDLIPLGESIENVTLVDLVDYADTDFINFTIGEIKTININLTIPANTTASFIFDAELEVNNTACLTLEDIRWVASGANVGCFGLRQTFEVIKNSTQGTTQMDQGYVDFGIVTNSGTTYRQQRYAAGDNVVQLEVDIRMCDCEKNVDGAIVKISLGAKTAQYISITEVDAINVRDNAEEPKLEVLCNLDGILSDGVGAVSVIAHMCHKPNSTAEGINTTLAIYYPDYLQNPSPSANKTYSSDSVDNSLCLTFDNFFFSDSCTEVNVSFTLDQATKMPPEVDRDFQFLTFETITNMIERTNNVNSTEQFCSDMCLTNFTSNVAGGGDNCSDPFMVSNSATVKDCQMYEVSGYKVEGNTAKDARKGSAAWTMPAVRGAGRNVRCIDVLLQKKGTVTEIEVEIGASSLCVPTKMQLYYSNSGLKKSYRKGDEIILPTDSNVYTVSVANPIESKWIKTCFPDDNCTTPVEGRSMKIGLELYGCYDPDATAPADICTEQKVEPTCCNTFAQKNRRTFCGLADLAYISFPMMDSDNDESVVAYSYNTNTVTTHLKNVGSFLGYHNLTETMYAASQDCESLMMSKDKGLTFQNVAQNQFDAASAETLYWNPCLAVPLGGDPNVDVTPPHADLRQGSFGCNYEGLHHTSDGGSNWNLKIDFQT